MLAVPKLSVVDNADGSGVTVSIAGSDPASTNAIAAQQVTGQAGTTWTTLGSRSGDGTLALAVGVGIWWFQCLSTTATQAALGNLVQQAVTDGSLAVHEQNLQAVEAAVITMATAGSLPGQPANQVYRQLVLDLKSIQYPAICILPPSGLGELLNTTFGGTNAEDDVGYPCGIIHGDRLAGDNAPGRPGYLLIRQRLLRRFRNQRLPGAPNFICQAEPAEIVAVKALEYQHLAGLIVVRTWNREVRGIL